jgi:TPR repeat protein
MKTAKLRRAAVIGAVVVQVAILATTIAVADNLSGQPLDAIKQLADAGRADAQRELGIRYGQGTGISQDYQVARTWASKAAAQGDPWAMHIMAMIYLNGLGVAVDRFRALDFLKRAADAGDMNAQYNLAVVYYQGDVTAKDYDKALTWYRRSADQGDTKAQHNLGLMLAHGVGIGADKVEAYKWFELSGSGDAVGAITEMQSLAPVMSKPEIAEAQRRAEVWHATLEWFP